MAEQFYTILTKVGKAKIANATALGTKVNFCKFQVGDSNGTYYNPTEEQTELRHKVWEGNINNIRIDEENPNWIIIEVLLPSNVGGFMIREAAILDDEDNVVAIAKYPETYKPQAQDGSSKDILIRTILEVSNASSVTLKLDPTVILATKKDIEILDNKIRNLKGVYAEDLLDETVIIEGEMHPLIKDEFEKVESQINENKENLEEVTSQMADMATQIKIRNNVTILASGWVNNISTSGYWVYNILDTDITENTIVDVNIHLSDLDKASSLKNSNLSTDGKVTLYAEEKLTDNIVVDLKLVKEVV